MQEANNGCLEVQEASSIRRQEEVQEANNGCLEVQEETGGAGGKQWISGGAEGKQWVSLGAQGREWEEGCLHRTVKKFDVMILSRPFLVPFLYSCFPGIQLLNCCPRSWCVCPVFFPLPNSR